MKLAASRSTRAVQMAQAALSEQSGTLRRTIWWAGTSLRSLAPKGQEGRPSKSLTLRQAHSLIEAAESSRLHGYIVLCLLTGCRTEEARALRWDHVDLDGDPDADPPVPPNVAVWRSVRSHGDVKTRKSRRTLRLPVAVVEALKVQKVRQAEDRLLAGSHWQDQGLVFASAVGTPLDASHVRRAFRKICAAAGIGENWTPRELRHTFVSIMSEQGVPVEEIARLVGHSITTTTETVYRQSAARDQHRR